MRAGEVVPDLQPVGDAAAAIAVNRLPLDIQRHRAHVVRHVADAVGRHQDVVPERLAPDRAALALNLPGHLHVQGGHPGPAGRKGPLQARERAVLGLEEIERAAAHPSSGHTGSPEVDVAVVARDVALLGMLAGHLDAQPAGGLQVEAQVAAPLVVAGRILGRETPARLQVRPGTEAAASEELQARQETRHRGCRRDPRAAPAGGPVEGIGTLRHPALARLEQVARAPRDHVDDPPHGIGAVKRRGSAPNDFHALHDLGVHGGQVLARTLAEGAVVEAHAVDHQEHLASRERTHEGGSLPRGGLLHQHAGLGDQGIEEEAAGLVAQFRAPHQVDRHGELVGGGRQTGRRHDQGIELKGRRVRIRLIRRRLRHGGTGSAQKGGPPDQDADRTRQLRHRNPLPVHAWVASHRARRVRFRGMGRVGPDGLLASTKTTPE